MNQEKFQSLFCESGIDKQLNLIFSTGEVMTNEDILYESMSLEESLCSDSKLVFGSCESAMFKIQIANSFVSHVGQTVEVKLYLGEEPEPFNLGTYKIYSDVPTADKLYRELTGYDALYDIINADGAEVANWYNSVLPNANSIVTLKQFRTSFLSHFGIAQEDVSLVNDGIVIAKTVDTSTMSGKDVISAICEINACFGHIGRDGVFKYIVLERMVEGLYPSKTLFPARNLYPKTPQGAENITKEHYISCKYEDFVTNKISKILIKDSEGSSGAEYGSGDNVYTINGNFLLYGKGATELGNIAKNIYGVIQHISYRPATIEAVGNPCMEVGDGVRLSTTYQIVYSYILKRTLTGIQALRDEYSAEGIETYKEDTNSVQSQIEQLKGKTNELKRTNEETISELKDLETNTESRFKQTASGFDMSVSKYGTTAYFSLKMKDADGNVIATDSDSVDIQSMVELCADTIRLMANKALVVDSPNFKLDANGNMVANDCTLNGVTINIPGDTYNGSLELNSNGMSLVFPQFTMNGPLAYTFDSNTFCVESVGTTNTNSIEFDVSEFNVAGHTLFTYGDKEVATQNWVKNQGYNKKDYSSKCDGFRGYPGAYGRPSQVYFSISMDGTYIKGYASTNWDSDVRIKRDITDLPDFTDIYMKLKPKKFKFKSEIESIDPYWQFGLIAQETISAFEEGGHSLDDSALVWKNVIDEDDMFNFKFYCHDGFSYKMDKDQLHALHIQMIQKQQKEIEKLKQENTLLKYEISKIKEVLGIE